MDKYSQAKFSEPLINLIGNKGRVGHRVSLEKFDIEKIIPKKLLREKLDLPELSEVEVVRHFTRLSHMSFGIDVGFYPLGSCTMKYNPKLLEAFNSLDSVRYIHPWQPVESIQGALEIMYSLEEFLKKISGMDAISLQPPAGASGEFSGMLIMRAYHRFQGNTEKNEVIVPDSAHGTNPASAAMAGFKVIEICSNENYLVDLGALEAAISPKTAGLMLTNPNTLGLFEKNIQEIVKIVKSVGGLLYYDGANLNAILGKCRPRDMGFDILHFNLHKTFGCPHGGGGPGAGPIGVTAELEKFLPIPRIRKINKKYILDYNQKYSIGKVQSFYGNFPIFLKALAYILFMGEEGLKNVAEISVLNANYLAQKLREKLESKGLTQYMKLVSKGLVKHEFVLTANNLKKIYNISAVDLAKFILDSGMHAPTINFPIIVKNSLMIEPTETEPKEILDRYADTLVSIIEKAVKGEKLEIKNTACTKLDEIQANRMPILSWKMLSKKDLK